MLDVARARGARLLRLGLNGLIALDLQGVPHELQILGVSSTIRISSFATSHRDRNVNVGPTPPRSSPRRPRLATASLAVLHGLPELARPSRAPRGLRRIRHRYIRPRRPQQNGKVERSHRIDQEAFWGRQRFADFDAAAVGLRAWETHYNQERFSLALQRRTPAEKLAALMPAVAV
jgi:transposase InsO family protein